MAFLPDGTYNSMLKKERYTMGILLIAIMLMNSMGYSPIGMLTGTVYQFLYKLIAL